jgi:hypothetical protein
MRGTFNTWNAIGYHDHSGCTETCVAHDGFCPARDTPRQWAEHLMDAANWERCENQSCRELYPAGEKRTHICAFPDA